MGATTGIDWCDSTWNPIRGCTRVSAGCIHCYAEVVASRFSGPGQPYEGLARMVNGHPRWTNKVRFIPEHLDDPLHWQKPRRIFVNSMSDLFHPDVEMRHLAAIWSVMALAPRHTFQILTKRPENIAPMLTQAGFYRAYVAQAVHTAIENHLGVPRNMATGAMPDPAKEPLPNVWIGTSVEDQAAADVRIPRLLEVPAAVRFLSCEPLLSAINLVPYLGGVSQDEDRRDGGTGLGHARCSVCGWRGARLAASGTVAGIGNRWAGDPLQASQGRHGEIEEGRLPACAGDYWEDPLQGSGAQHCLDGSQPTDDSCRLRGESQGRHQRSQPPEQSRTDDPARKRDPRTTHVGPVQRPKDRRSEVTARASAGNTQALRSEDHVACPNCGALSSIDSSDQAHRQPPDLEVAPRINWVIAGGESGPGCRPMDAAWARSLRDQCQAAGVAFWFKQWGGRTSKAGGKELDGVEHCAFPEVA